MQVELLETNNLLAKRLGITINHMPPNRPGLRSQRLSDGAVLTVQRGLLDKQAAALYLILDQDGLLPFYFHESLPSLTDFLRMATVPANVFYGCFLGHENSERVDLVGLISGTNYVQTGSGGRLDAGMVFAKSVHKVNSEIAIEFAELAMDDAFEAEDLKLVAMYGITPKPNLAALRFMKRLGFVDYGVAPLLCTWMGESVDAVMSALTREQWYSRAHRTAHEEVAVN